MMYLLAFLVLVVLSGISLYGWHLNVRKAERLVNAWAAENGYRVLSRERRSLCRGPFFWRSNKFQIVFLVTLQEPGGNVRKAWLRCGGTWTGMSSDKIAVEWEG